MNIKTSLRCPLPYSRLWSIPRRISWRLLLFGAIPVILLLPNESGFAQLTADWLKVRGTADGYDAPTQLVRGPGGEFYLPGSFGGPSGLTPEAVLFKLDSGGHEIERLPWRGATINALALSVNGESYLTGYVRDPDLLGVGQKYDFYLAKYAADGSLLWERTAGTPRTDVRNYQEDIQMGNAILLDADGNLLVAGQSYGPAIYGTIQFPNKQGGPLLAKFTPAGELLWVKRVEISKQLGSGFFGWASTVMVDRKGNIVIGGSMSDGLASFGGTVVNINGYFDYGPFTAKFTPTGEVVWVRTTASAGAVDPQGNIYATEAHALDVMVSTIYKYDPAGTTLWDRTFRGVSLKPLAMDSRGDPIFGGTYTGTVQLDDYQLQNDTVGFEPWYDDKAALVAKVDGMGRFQWVVAGKGGGLQNWVSGVIADPAEGFYVLGGVACVHMPDESISCEGQPQFGSLPFSIEQGGNSDFFLAHITDPAPLTFQLKIELTSSGFDLSWPLGATNYVLETTSSLSAALWQTVTTVPPLGPTDFRLHVPFTGDSAFFRLKMR